MLARKGEDVNGESGGVTAKAREELLESWVPLGSQLSSTWILWECMMYVPGIFWWDEGGCGTWTAPSYPQCGLGSPGPARESLDKESFSIQKTLSVFLFFHRKQFCFNLPWFSDKFHSWSNSKRQNVILILQSLYLLSIYIVPEEHIVLASKTQMLCDKLTLFSPNPFLHPNLNWG